MTDTTRLLALARADLGLREIPGFRHEPRVVACYADCGHPEIDADEVAWCAAWVGSKLKAAGYPLPPRAINLMARSYLNWGRALAVPEPGCIAVWPRGKPPQGHVNIVESVDHAAGTVTCIGGNQWSADTRRSDAVTRSTHPIADALAFRAPVAATKQALREAGSSEIATADTLRAAAKVVGSVAAAGTALNGAATPPPPAPTPDPVLPPTLPAFPELDGVTDGLDDVSGLLTGADAVWHLVAANPWLAAAVAACAGAWLVAVRLEANRLARARAGAPIGAQLLED